MVATLPPASINTAAAVASQQYGLLTATLIVAVMRQFGLSSIASHDDDFDRVLWITRYSQA